MFGRRKREREELVARIAGNLGAQSRIALTQDLWQKVPREERLGEDWVSFGGDDVDGYVILAKDRSLHWVAPDERTIREWRLGADAAFAVVGDDPVSVILHDWNDDLADSSLQLVMRVSADSRVIAGLRAAGVEEDDDED